MSLPSLLLWERFGAGPKAGRETDFQRRRPEARRRREASKAPWLQASAEILTERGKSGNA